MARLDTFMQYALAAAIVATALGCNNSSEPEIACYAPDKNVGTAFEEGSVGCECDEESAGQCVDGTGLICEDGHWQAVLDGPCFPPPGERCGNQLCSIYAHCEEPPGGTPMCVSGRRP
jgi:hypothetical protein